jgi:GTP-binding protein EngB required for normal cell division
MVEARDVLDVLDLAITRSEGVLSTATIEDFAERARRARTRTGFLGEALVVAMAGGTGCGKSSILNALIGEDVVATGIMRPTTQTATAIHAPRAFTDLAPLLDALDVDTIVLAESSGDVIFVDLPDFDSIERAHRHVVERVLPRVDAVVWVLDPEKYADPVLHRDFLEHLAGYERQFIFAMNQCDRITADLDVVIGSLRRHLRFDGFDDPDIVATIAVEIEGDPADVGELRDVIDRRMAMKETALRKVALDMRAVATEGWRACTDVDLRNLGERSRDSVALAAASFVWLGITAYELYHRHTDGMKPDEHPAAAQEE